MTDLDLTPGPWWTLGGDRQHHVWASVATPDAHIGKATCGATGPVARDDTLPRLPKCAKCVRKVSRS